MRGKSNLKLLTIPEVRERLAELKSALDPWDFLNKVEWLAGNISYSAITQMVKDDTVYSRTYKAYDPTTEEYGKTYTGEESIELFSGYVDSFEEALKEGYSFLFYGPNSTGKTYLAQWVLSCVIEEGYKGYYIHFKDYMEMYNAVVHRGTTHPALLKWIEKCDLLVLDELGKESKASPNVIGELERLLKLRTEARLPTIVVTNLFAEPDHPDEDCIIKRYGNSVLSVMHSRYKMLRFSHRVDFRKETRKVWGEE